MLRLRFGDPGQYELRIISMREQQFRSDLARGILTGRTNRNCARGPRHDDAPSSWLVFVQSAGTLHWLGRPSPNRGTIYRSLLMTSQDFQAELASVLNRRFEMSHTKDIDFSALGISACREAGYAATWNTLERAAWRGKFDRLKA